MIKRFHALQDTYKGIAFMVSAMLCFSVMSAAIRHASAMVPTPELVFMRNLMSLLLLLPFAVWLGLPALKTRRFKIHFYRSSAGIIGMELWFYALSVISLNVATAITFSTPIYVTLGAIIFFGERVGWRRWMAIAIGFIGVIIILRPGTEAFEPLVGFAIGASFMQATAGLLIKNLSRTESAFVTLFYMSMIMTGLSFPLAVPVWQAPSLEQLGWMLAIAASSTLAHYCLINAYMHAEAQVIMPFDFTRLLFTAVIAWFAFGEVLDAWTLTGALVILTSTVYVAHRERRKSRKKQALIEEPETM